MALAMLEALRHSMLQEIQILVDADVGAGDLIIYNGTQPATGGAATTALATCPLSDPAAPAASGGVLTFDTITPDATGVAGTATWFRLTDNSGDFVLDGTVGTGSEDLVLNTVAITTNANVEVTSFTITAPNA